MRSFTAGKGAILLTAIWTTALAQAQAPLSGGFTYQGQLKQNGQPASGSFNMVFKLFDQATGGTQIGNPATLQNVAVANGLFTVQLNTANEFGANAFTGDARWLEITVGSTTLAPRQALTAAPYATYAAGPWVNEGNNLLATLGEAAVGAPTSWTARFGILQGAETVGLSVRRAAGNVVQQFCGTSDCAYIEMQPTGTGAGGLLLGTNGQGGHAAVTIDSGSGHIGVGEPPTGDVVMDIGDRIRLRSNGANSAGTWYWDGVDRAFAGLEDANHLGYWSPGLGWYFLTNPTNGFVGIGNPEPKTFLHIGSRTTLSENADAGATFAVANLGANLFYRNSQYFQVDGSKPGANFSATGDTTLGHEFKFTRIDQNGGNIRDIAVIGTGGHYFIGNVGINRTSPTQALDVVGSAAISGNVTCGNVLTTKVLTITGGADIAEPFSVNHSDAQAIEPGMVVCIDPQRPGALKLATAAYDPTVAGVISGAGGVNAGLMLRHTNTAADGDHPVALTGRVYVWVDASAGGAVKPGDLLTTSDTPGHAMKATDRDRATGAILGKAMGTLDQGTGLVLVLVTLQ